MPSFAVTVKLPSLRILRTENTSVFFEMREYKPSRVHAAVENEKDEDITEKSQTERKCLFIICRTDKLFVDTPNDLINDGGPKVFNVF